MIGIGFSGVKIALLLGDKLLVIQRDNKPGLPFAGLWDLAGGGREGDESPEQCASREVKEELGISLSENDIIYKKIHLSIHDMTVKHYFMAARINQHQIDNIVFGDEGQGWKLIPIGEFLSADDVVGPLKGRLQDYLDSLV